MHRYFHKLFRYTGWANQAVIQALVQHGIADDYIIKTMSHIIHAQFIWLSRIIPHPYSFQLWEKLSLEQMAQLSEENKQHWLDYLEKKSINEFTQIVSYSNTSGQPFETVLADIMAHVINHSTYHRAQIAKALRDLGIAPPNTDYIRYCRKFDDIGQK